MEHRKYAIMIVLRVFLYLTCFISLGWSVLVFGGPPIIKKLISGYSNGALIPSGVTLSPGLNVSISRLDFVFQSETTGRSVGGFSRATEIAWSIFGDKPFLEIRLGPSLLENYVTAKNVNIYTPPLREIDWQNISMVGNIDTLVLNSFAKAHSLTLVGNLNLKSVNVSNIHIVAEKFSAGHDGLTYSANQIKSKVSELNFNSPINEQEFSTTLAVKDIMVSELDFNVSKAFVEVVQTKDLRDLKIDLHDIKLLKGSGSINNVKLDGSWNQDSLLQNLQIDLVNGVFFDESLKFPDISAQIKKSSGDQYLTNIEGYMDEFGLFNSDNFIGLLPGGNFVIDLELDKEASKVFSISKISFNTVNADDINGIFEMEFRSRPLKNLECSLADCDLSDFDFAYQLNLNDEWVRGSANCAGSTCGIAEMDHLVRTSDTVNIFTILNRANILNPLYSIYLYGVISSGQKINGGHELKFQF